MSHLHSIVLMRSHPVMSSHSMKMKSLYVFKTATHKIETQFKFLKINLSSCEKPKFYIPICHVSHRLLKCLCLIGAAYSRAETEILQFVEQLGLPYLPSPMGKGVIPDNHPQCVIAARSK